MMNDLKTKEFEKKLGYSFKDKKLLNRALTHESYAHEHQDCEYQEVFRTLGDAVLKAVLVDLLIKSGCKTSGEITTRKEGLEREERLVEIGHELGIGAFIRLGVGAEQEKVNEKPKVLAGTLEALVGAIYLDGEDDGYSASKEVITKWWPQM